MPLAFQSLNQGVVTFGFFNIDVDMLLLNNCFMFADTFCRLVSELARHRTADDYQTEFMAYVIERVEDVGDLMGAIHSVRYTGFIGAVYRRFPFPSNPEDFKQNPNGYRNHQLLETIIESYAEKRELPFLSLCSMGRVTMGGYEFDLRSFRDLVKYVLHGGMPGWKDGLRPAYVTAMVQEIAGSNNHLFDGFLED